jgi:hypothetical protein
LESLVNHQLFNIPVLFAHFCYNEFAVEGEAIDVLSSQMDLLFSLMKEKEVFLRLYEQHLALKLLRDYKYSTALMDSFFEKVKQRNGSNSISKIRGMLGDAGKVGKLSSEFEVRSF